MAGPGQVVEPPWQGAVPVAATGVGAWVRIPFPGKGNLVLSLRPPAQWKGPSPSAIFVMEPGSKYKGLRLDYSFNKKTNCIDYHWNRNGRQAVPGLYRIICRRGVWALCCTRGRGRSRPSGLSSW